MSAREWLLGVVCVCALLITVTGAPDTQATWLADRRSPPQQTLHGLMVSIDERLRTLETTRWEATLKQVEQRLDSVESSIRRLDSVWQDRLDKLDRSFNSKDLKDELSMEKLSHKVRDFLDSSYDRYNRRLGYTEEQLEMSLKKVQMGIESSLNRIEKQQEDMQSEVLEAVTILEDLKSHSTTTEDKLNSTHRAIKHHIQSLMTPNHDELQRISGSLENLGTRLNNSLGGWGSQNDGPQVGDFVTTIRKEINIEANKFTNKVNNMYNDLWRRVVSVESLVKDLSRLGNTTQREVLEEVRSLVLTERRDFPGDSQENYLEVGLDALEGKLQRKLTDLGHKLDTLSATQNLVMDSCFDDGCRSLDTRLSQVLERIIEVFSDRIEGFSNRTFNLDSLVVEMMELVKTQHSQLIRTVTHNTNMVVTLTKDSSDANKMLHNSVIQLADKTDNHFQELHDEVQEMCHISGKVYTDSDKTNEEHTDQHKPPDTPPRNITEIKVVTRNVTQPSKITTMKPHDAGVLKITTDDIEILVDNNTIKTPPAEESATNSADRSIMQMIGMISPNLTQSQVETLLQYLNSSVNLENLEAIIQNTEAEAEVESVEIHNRQSPNKSNEDSLDVLAKKLTKMLSLENSLEGDIISEETNDDLENTVIKDSEAIKNTTEFGGMESIVGVNNTQISDEEISSDIKEQLKVYVLLLRIKHGNFNFTDLRKYFEEKSNKSEDQISQQYLPVLQKLCYSEENTQGFTSEYLNNTMRNRLLLINQTINDVNLYKKIENICNTMIESQQSQSVSEEFPPED